MRGAVRGFRECACMHVCVRGSGTSAIGGKHVSAEFCSERACPTPEGSHLHYLHSNIVSFYIRNDSETALMDSKLMRKLHRPGVDDWIIRS